VEEELCSILFVPIPCNILVRYGTSVANMVQEEDVQSSAMDAAELVSEMWILLIRSSTPGRRLDKSN
jgi:hypothetical protein